MLNAGFDSNKWRPVTRCQTSPIMRLMPVKIVIASVENFNGICMKSSSGRPGVNKPGCGEGGENALLLLSVKKAGGGGSPNVVWPLITS